MSDASRTVAFGKVSDTAGVLKSFSRSITGERFPENSAWGKYFRRASKRTTVKLSFSKAQCLRTEQDVVAEIEYTMKKNGIMHMSFDTIVQSGANAADPHGAPKADLIKPNELCLFDLGVDYKGYIKD